MPTNDNFTAQKEESHIHVRKMVFAGIFAALIGICAWIAVPIPTVSFTMQTFGVLLALGILGGKWGTVSIFLYLSLGLVGLPVFSGFRGGAAALLEPAGGFLWGFLLAGLAYWLLERVGKCPAMVFAMAVIYACGCWWFTFWAGVPWGTAFLTCGVPYLIPDAVKLWLAYTLSKRLAKHLRR